MSKHIPFSLISSCVLICLLWSCENGKGPTKDSLAKSPTLFNSIQQSAALPFNVKADIESLLLRKSALDEYSATLSYPINNKTIEWKVSLSPRGNMRNRYCDLPPLKIDFSKEAIAEAGYNAAFDDFKIVHTCKDDEPHRALVMREYLAYKLYNQLTDYSFRVQLLDFSLEDSEGKLYKVASKGFLLEKDDELAHRLNGRVLKPKNVSRAALQAEVFDMMALFQFMIGNTDWFIYNQHNIKILKVEGELFPIPVPYDFDYAGLVDADYAIPEERLPLSDIKERYYLGACRTYEELQPIFQRFKDNKESILKTCAEFRPLSKDIRTEMTTYIADFFEILEDEVRCKKMIVQHCDKQIKIKK